LEADANSFSAYRSSPGHDRGEGRLEPKMHQEAGFQLATPPFVPFVSDRGAEFSLIRAYICERDIHQVELSVLGVHYACGDYMISHMNRLPVRGGGDYWSSHHRAIGIDSSGKASDWMDASLGSLNS
jgi:hypothetical protein